MKGRRQIDDSGFDLRRARMYRMPGVIEALTFLMIAGQAGALGAGLAAVGAAYGGTLLGLGAVIGLNLAMRQKPPTPTQSDVQANIRQPLAARRRHYGRVKAGSVIVFGFRRRDHICIVHYIGEGPIQGYVQHFLNNKPVTLDVNGFVTDGQYYWEGRSRVKIVTRLGLPDDEPFDEIIGNYPELDDPLKPFRFKGCAVVLTIFEQVGQEALADVYPNNLPTYQTIIDGVAEVIDPADGSFGFSDNAARCLLTEIMDVYGLTYADTDDIDFAAFETYAAHCDQAVALKAGGTEKRYRAAGTISLDAENEGRISALANVCNADVYFDRAGRISVRERIQTTPGIALRAKNGDHLAVDLTSGRALQRQCNTLHAIYVESSLNWKEHQAIYVNEADLDADGQEFAETFPIQLCPSGTQAQRLAKLRYAEMNPAYAGSLTSGLQALDLLEDHCFTLDLSPEDDFERVFSAQNIELDEGTLAVSFGMVSYADGATAWDPAIDEKDIVIVPPDLATAVTDVSLDVTVTMELIEGVPFLKLSWEGDGTTLPDSWSQRVQVSLEALLGASWSDATVDQSADEAVYPVIDGRSYIWRIRNIAGGVTFDWQTGGPITIAINTTPPAALASVSATGAAGKIDLSFRTASTNAPKSVKVYLQSGTGGALNRGTDLVQILTSLNPGTTYPFDLSGLSAGTYTVWLEPFNESGVAGTLSGPHTPTVT